MSHLSASTQRLAGRLQLLCFGVIAGLLVVGLVLAFRPDILVEEAANRLFGGALEWSVGPMAKVGLLGIGGVGLSVLIFTLWQTARLFGCYAEGEAVSPEAATAMRRIGIGLLAQALTGVLGTTLTGLLLSLGAPVGQRLLVLSIGSGEIAFALIGGLLLLIGLMMHQAADALRENREFI